MNIHKLSVNAAIESLHSSNNGLSETEALRRLQQFGLNTVTETKGETMFARFIKGFIHFFALILWIAAGLAFFANWREPGQGMATLAIAIIIVILINGTFSFWQEYRTEQALTALKNLLPQQVKAKRKGKIYSIPAKDLVPGDIILLEEGDQIPADCRMIEGYGVQVNNATITGESVSQSRDEQPSNNDDLLHSKNILLTGTSVVSGQAQAIVFATGMHTEFGKIAHLTQSFGEVLSPLQKEVSRLSRLIALLATGLGVIFFFIGESLNLSFWQNIIFMIGIIVANVPEGLLPTVTLALAMASQRLANKNALIRHLPSVETLGSTTVICTDKTGTLTQNKMGVECVFISNRRYDRKELIEDKTFYRSHRQLIECMLLCENLKESEVAGKPILLGDPMEIALVELAKKLTPEKIDYHRIDEIPFDSERKLLSSLHQTNNGLILYSKGALERLLPLCSYIKLESEIKPLTSAVRDEILNQQELMATDGLRVLAFAFRNVSADYQREHLEEELIFTGLVGLLDPPRVEVPAAIEKCRAAGIKVIMVTGDHPSTACAIARQVGLVRSEHPVIVTGQELKILSDAQLNLLLDGEELIFARLAADQKLRIVNGLQQKREIVAVTGDGVNDAPALKKADIGIAMGIAGTDVAKQAADMILLDDNFATIVTAIEEGRAVYENIRKFLTYILTSNVPELIPYLAFVIFKIPLALTIIQILVVDLGTDMLPALGLGIEKPDTAIMQRAPRPTDERLLNLPLLLHAYIFLGLFETLAAFTAFFLILRQAGWQYGQNLALTDPTYLKATTACLTAIIIMQVFNVFICRSNLQSIFSRGITGNRLIIAGVLIEILLILFIDYTKIGNTIFNTAPIPSIIWLVTIPIGIAMVLMDELRKLLLTRKKSNNIKVTVNNLNPLIKIKPQD